MSADEKRWRLAPIDLGNEARNGRLDALCAALGTTRADVIRRLIDGGAEACGVADPVLRLDAEKLKSPPAAGLPATADGREARREG